MTMTFCVGAHDDVIVVNEDYDRDVDVVIVKDITYD